MKTRTCAVPGCERPFYARSLCHPHWKQGRAAGMPTLPRMPVEDRFWKRVEKADDCWLWTGSSLSSEGYGTITVNGKHVYAHRLSYEMANGPIAAGLQIDHLCRVRHCVNPDHLEPVTQRTNILRGTSPAAHQAQQTHCKRGHEFTPENTRYELAHPRKRHCRECQEIRNRARYSTPALEETLA